VTEEEECVRAVVRAAPAAGRLEGPPPGDDGSRVHELVHDRAVDTARSADCLHIDLAVRHQPVVQPIATRAEAVVWSLVRPGDEPVQRHGHVENAGGHGARLLLGCQPRPYLSDAYAQTR